MEHMSQLERWKGIFRAPGKAKAFSIAVLATFTVGGVQAAQLTCGTPLRVHTAKDTWTADARYVSDPTGAAAPLRDDYQWTGGIGGWLNKTTTNHLAAASELPGSNLTGLIQGDWISFGDAPSVITNGVVTNGALVAGRVSFTYKDKITIANNVNLSSIKIRGTGGFDNYALFLVKPDSPPSGATDWVRTTAGSGAGMNDDASPSLISLDGNTTGLGFYYGDNTIGFAIQNYLSQNTDSSNVTGVIADFEITADCLTAPAPQPTQALICPAGNTAGDTVRIGPFTTNARDWKWLWRTNAAGNALENVEQPLSDSYIYRSYFNPGTLPAGQETNARWISPGTTDPSAGDIPGVPYPAATGQAKAGYHASVFVMNQPITVGNNVDLASIKLDGRFGFDDYGNSVFVQPAGGAPVFDNSGLYMPNGYGSFQTATTPAIPGFTRGQNTIGLMLDGLQSTNDCGGGTCAMAAIADFYVTAACTGVDPTPPSDQTITFPAQTSPRRVADGAFTLSPTATASSTLPVTYTSLTPEVCTVSGTTVTPVAVGQCQIAADQAGGTVDTTVFNAAVRVVQSVALQNAPVVSSATPVPALGAVGLGLLGLLSAGLGGLALRRRQQS